MEGHANRYALPSEIWQHILNFVEDWSSIIASKRTNKLFYNYMKPRSTLTVIKDINWNNDVINKFANRELPPRMSEKELPSVIRQEKVKHDSYDAYKVTIAGSSDSGKTHLRNWLAGISLNENTPVSIIVQNPTGTASTMVLVSIITIIDSNEAHKVDLEGMEIYVHYLDRYRPSPKQFFRGAKAVVILFALNNRSSFIEAVEKWMHMLYLISDDLEFKFVEFFLVGTKLDLEGRQVELHEAKMLVYELKLHYFEINVHNEQHRDKLKNAIHHAVLENACYQKALENQNSKGGFVLTDAPTPRSNSQEPISRCIVL